MDAYQIVAVIQNLFVAFAVFLIFFPLLLSIKQAVTKEKSWYNAGFVASIYGAAFSYLFFKLAGQTRAAVLACLFIIIGLTCSSIDENRKKRGSQKLSLSESFTDNSKLFLTFIIDGIRQRWIYWALFAIFILLFIIR